MAMQNTVTNDYSKLTVTPKKESTTPPKKTTLGQQDFLKLMTTQMTHQDPTKPMENTQFITQMAQFGTVSGIQDLQKSFSDFAGSISSGQALQASSLVGRYVSAPGTKGLLEKDGSISGDINLPSDATSVHVKVTNASTGAIVREADLGSQSTGKVPFTWDGLDANNAAAKPGVYKIQATGYIDGKNTSLDTDIKSQVDSVSMGSGGNGVKVNLTGLGSVDFNQIKQIL